MYDIKNTKYKRCTILLKEDIYQRLKTKGKFGESFSELICRLLDDVDFFEKNKKEKIYWKPQNNELASTIEFLSKDCKSKNHVNCCKVWAGIGIQVICNCSCHNDDSNDSYTI